MNFTLILKVKGRTYVRPMGNDTKKAFAQFYHFVACDTCEKVELRENGLLFAEYEKQLKNYFFSFCGFG